MIRIKKILTSTLLAAMLLSSVTSCRKYLDVNQNLNSATSVPIGTLMTYVQMSIAGTVSLGSTLGNGLGVYTHQLMQYGSYNRYGINGSTMADPWSRFYTALGNLDQVLLQADQEGKFAYAGMAKILKAYTFSIMVDIWGDIPYSEFNKFKSGIKQPKFDDDATIYPQLLEMIDEGIVDLNNTSPQVKPGADDLIYKGNLTKWVKAANTIKLKLYTQMRLVKNVETEVKALLANPALLINAQDESFLMPYGPYTTTDDRYPGYGDYSAAQRGGQIPSHWLWEIMKGKNDDILTGNEDPRVPYYFYRQKSASAAPENCTDYRDGGFITLIFGSQSPCVGGSNSNTYTLLGIYPIGGRYDDGAGVQIGASSGTVNAANAGTGAAPQRLLTYADRLFLEAELINVGLANGNQATVFENAVKAAFAQVDHVVTNYVKPATQTVPTVANTTATTNYIDALKTSFNAANNTKKLEHIMTQKWISRFGNSVDNYTDYRRTGYPVMFSPAPVGSITSVAIPGGAGGIGIPTTNGGRVLVSNGTPYPVSLPWSTTEIEQNANAPAQKVPHSYKVFWMP